MRLWFAFFTVSNSNVLWAKSHHQQFRMINYVSLCVSARAPYAQQIKLFQFVLFFCYSFTALAVNSVAVVWNSSLSYIVSPSHRNAPTFVAIFLLQIIHKRQKKDKKKITTTTTAKRDTSQTVRALKRTALLRRVVTVIFIVHIMR